MRATLRCEPLEAREVPAANFFAIGAEPGSGGGVSLVDADSGVTRFTTYPFGVNFPLGVNVAVGDLTGDSIPDLIATPGAGGGPVVAIVNGLSGTLLKSQIVLDPNFRGGLSVAAGDVNLDGLADVIVGAGAGGGPVVVVLDGKTATADAPPPPLATFFAFDPAFRGGVSVAAGDVDGDGRADAVVGAGGGGAPHVKAFSVATGTPTQKLSFFTFDPAFRGGVTVAAGDVDGDGITDVVTGAGRGGAPHVQSFRGTDLARTGSFFAAAADDRNGVLLSTVNEGNGATTHLLTAAGGQVTEFTGAGQYVAAIYGRALPLGGPAAAADNAAVIWTQFALDAIRAEGTPPPKAARNLGILAAAVFDAVNSITPRYTPYHFTTLSPAGADPVAAALQAGYAAATSLFTTQAVKDKARAILVARMSLIPDSSAKADGVLAGQRAATNILSFRATDGSVTAQFAVAPGTDPGDWQPTPPANAAYLLPGWGNLTPFAIPDVASYRPAAPPALASQAYADALNQVKDLGAATSTTRTADQTQIANFWKAGGGTVTPPGMAMELAVQVIHRQDLPLLESARALALVGLAEADAGVVAWDAKSAYDFWRPVTAIRAADADGNARTTADATWTPLIPTPPFPSYTSGHSTFSAAAAAVLTGLFGEDYAFRFFSQDVPGASRAFTSFGQASEEAGLSRIYGGIHYSFDNAAGLSSGSAIGDYVVTNLLKPVP